jgi:Rrf2 family protein
MFNKETEYALRGLVYIFSRNKIGERPGIIEIAKEIDAPQFFIAKILQRLVKFGVIRSIKGKGGGFYFDPDKPDLSLMELVKLTGGSKSLTGCGFGLKQCDAENPCPLHEQYAPIREAVINLISTETIGSLETRYK